MRFHLNHAGGAALALLAMLVIGCQTAPKSEEGKADLEQTAQTALTRMQEQDPNIDDMIEKGHGYAIFPNAGKGGLVLGGGYGKGVVYDDAGTQIGFADITQLSAGAQIGGQSFSELIVFENQAALDRFKNNELNFGANASAVIIKKGVGSATTFKEGTAVYILPKAGAMAEAAVGGQKFTFTTSEGSGQPSTRPAQRASGTETSTDTGTSTGTGTETEVRTTETKTEVKTEQKTNTD
jgi:lipid-binding SYLF domain-containing protein